MRLPAADAILRNGKNHAAAAALASFLLAAPLSPDVASTLLPLPIGVPAASARELASGSGSKVNKDPNSLLRLGLPGIPKEMQFLCTLLFRSPFMGSQVIKMAAIGPAVPGGSYLCNCFVERTSGVDDVSNKPDEWEKLWQLTAKSVADGKFP